MKRLAIDFLEECEALHALLEPLGEAELDQATAFKGWPINRVIQHLHVWNLAAGLSLQGDESFPEFYGRLEAHRGAGGTMGSFEREWLGGLSGPALVDAWRKGCVEIADRFANADPSGRVKWAGPFIDAAIGHLSEDSTEDLCDWIVGQGSAIWAAACGAADATLVALFHEAHAERARPGRWRGRTPAIGPALFNAHARRFDSDDFHDRVADVLAIRAEEDEEEDDDDDD